MKIRSDFVSNSSSSSYVIATNSTYDTDQMIKDISDNCECNFWDNYGKMKKTIANNVALYIGYMKSGINTEDFDSSNPDHLYLFTCYKKYLEDDKYKNDIFARCLRWLDDEHTIIRYEESLYDSAVVDISTMKKLVKMNADEILKFLESKEFQKTYQLYSYMINEDSLVVTEKLLEAGKEFHFYNNKYTIDDFRRMIREDKDKLYNIHVNRDGDGCDDDAFRNESNNCDVTDGLAIEVLAGENY